MTQASTLNTTNDNFKSFILGSGATEKKKDRDDNIEAIPERDDNDLNSRSVESGDEREKQREGQSPDEARRSPKRDSARTETERRQATKGAAPSRSRANLADLEINPQAAARSRSSSAMRAAST